MNENLYEALEVSLNALEAGADLETVLRRFPDIKDNLRPLLETSQQASSLSLPEVSAVVQQRAKARVLGHAAQMRASSAKPRRHLMLFAFPRLATSLAIAIIFFLLSGTGLVRASNGALPGDQLYPVKRTWEDVRLALVLNPEGREQLQSEFGKERLQEIDELMVEKRHATISFSGLLGKQSGNIWMVSTVPVHITAATQLPEEPVSAGATIKVNGWTNAQGFVEAVRVEILTPGVILPIAAPTEIESHKDPAVEQNESSVQEETESDSSSTEYQSKNEGSGENHNEDTNSSQYDSRSKDQGGGSNSGEENRRESNSGGDRTEGSGEDH